MMMTDMQRFVVLAFLTLSSPVRSQSDDTTTEEVGTTTGTPDTTGDTTVTTDGTTSPEPTGPPNPTPTPLVPTNPQGQGGNISKCYYLKTSQSFK